MKIYKFACALSIVGLIICICTQSTYKANNAMSKKTIEKPNPTILVESVTETIAEATVIQNPIAITQAALEQETIEPKPQEQWVSLGEFRITFYCPCEKCCGKWSGMGITATGEPIEYNRTIAVDPSVIPYYSEIKIDGLNYQYRATDCGGAIKGNEIDVLVEKHETALNYGVMYTEVYMKVGE